MSTTLTKRSLHQAMTDANAFRNCVPKEFWHRWEFAGSLRRQRPDVADVEHVIIPVMKPAGQAGLFTAEVPPTLNTLWDRVEEMVRLGTFAKHVYHTVKGDQFRWGEKYRGIDFRGLNHEIWCADLANWGSILAIRTGPAELAQRLVTALKRKGLVNRGGYVRNPHLWACSRCGERRGHPADEPVDDAFRLDVADYISGEREGVKCRRCGELMRADIVSCPEEADFFNMAGLPQMPPERRFA